MTKIQYENQEERVLSAKERLVLFSLLLGTGLLTVLDVYEDWLDGAPMSHIVPEVFIIFLSVGIGVYLIKNMLLRRKKIISSAREEIEEVRLTANEWKEKATQLSKGVSDAIEQQFDSWGLTPAEKEVAFLLLKGLSIVEISSVRETTERTVRQQASEIYKKSGLSGRAQLSAFFLEDLFDRA